MKGTTSPETDIPIEYIKRIQAFDIWPARHKRNVSSLFMKSKARSHCSFDEIILSRLDNMERKQWQDVNKLNLIFENPKGKDIDQSVFQEAINILNAISQTKINHKKRYMEKNTAYGI